MPILRKRSAPTKSGRRASAPQCWPCSPSRWRASVAPSRPRRAARRPTYGSRTSSRTDALVARLADELTGGRARAASAVRREADAPRAARGWGLRGDALRGDAAPASGPRRARRSARGLLVIEVTIVPTPRSPRARRASAQVRGPRARAARAAEADPRRRRGRRRRRGAAAESRARDPSHRRADERGEARSARSRPRARCARRRAAPAGRSRRGEGEAQRCTRRVRACDSGRRSNAVLKARGDAVTRRDVAELRRVWWVGTGSVLSAWIHVARGRTQKLPPNERRFLQDCSLAATVFKTTTPKVAALCRLTFPPRRPRAGSAGHRRDRARHVTPPCTLARRAPTPTPTPPMSPRRRATCSRPRAPNLSRRPRTRCERPWLPPRGARLDGAAPTRTRAADKYQLIFRHLFSTAARRVRSPLAAAAAALQSRRWRMRVECLVRAAPGQLTSCRTSSTLMPRSWRAICCRSSAPGKPRRASCVRRGWRTADDRLTRPARGAGRGRTNCLTRAARVDVFAMSPVSINMKECVRATRAAGSSCWDGLRIFADQLVELMRRRVATPSWAPTSIAATARRGGRLREFSRRMRAHASRRRQRVGAEARHEVRRVWRATLAVGCASRAEGGALCTSARASTTRLSGTPARHLDLRDSCRLGAPSSLLVVASAPRAAPPCLALRQATPGQGCRTATSLHTFHPRRQRVGRSRLGWRPRDDGSRGGRHPRRARRRRPLARRRALISRSCLAVSCARCSAIDASNRCSRRVPRGLRFGLARAPRRPAPPAAADHERGLRLGSARRPPRRRSSRRRLPASSAPAPGAAAPRAVGPAASAARFIKARSARRGWRLQHARARPLRICSRAGARARPPAPGPCPSAGDLDPASRSCRRIAHALSTGVDHHALEQAQVASRASTDCIVMSRIGTRRSAAYRPREDASPQLTRKIASRARTSAARRERRRRRGVDQRVVRARRGGHRGGHAVGPRAHVEVLGLARDAGQQLAAPTCFMRPPMPVGVAREHLVLHEVGHDVRQALVVVEDESPTPCRRPRGCRCRSRRLPRRVLHAHHHLAGHQADLLLFQHRRRARAADARVDARRPYCGRGRAAKRPAAEPVFHRVPPTRARPHGWGGQPARRRQPCEQDHTAEGACVCVGNSWTTIIEPVQSSNPRGSMPRHQMCGVGLKRACHSFLVENLTLTQESTLSAGLILRERVSYVEQ